MKNKERLLDTINTSEFSLELQDFSNKRISIDIEKETNNYGFVKMKNEKLISNDNINNDNNNKQKNKSFYNKEILDDERFPEKYPKIIKEEKNMSEKEKEKFIKQQYEGYQTYCIHEELKENENSHFYFSQFFEIFILHLLFSIFGIFIVPLYRLIYGRELIRNLGFWGKKNTSTRNAQYFYWICFIITVIFSIRIQISNKKFDKNLIISEMKNNKNFNQAFIIDDIWFNQYIFLSMAYMSILLVILRYLIVSIKYGFFPKNYFNSVKYKLIYKSNLKYNFIKNGWINPDFYLINIYFHSAFNYLNVNPKRFFLECVGKIDQNLEKKILEIENDFSDGHLKRRNSYIRRMKKTTEKIIRYSFRNSKNISKFINIDNNINTPNISFLDNLSSISNNISQRRIKKIDLKRNSIIRRYSNSLNSNSLLNYFKRNSINNNNNNMNTKNSNINRNYISRGTYDNIGEFSLKEKTNSFSILNINNNNGNGINIIYNNEFNSEFIKDNSNLDLNSNINNNNNSILDKENDYFDEIVSTVKNPNYNNNNNNNNIEGNNEGNYSNDALSNFSGASGVSGFSDENQSLPKIKPIMKLKKFVNVTLKMHLNNLKKKVDLKKKTLKGKLETLNKRVYKINGLYMAKIMAKKINEINFSTFQLFHLVLFLFVLIIPNLFIYNLYSINVTCKNNNAYNFNEINNCTISNDSIKGKNNSINQKNLASPLFIIKNIDNNNNNNSINNINNKTNNERNNSKIPEAYNYEEYNPFYDFKLIDFNYISIIFLIFSLITAIIPVWLNTEHLIYGLIDFSRRRKSMELLYQILNPKNIECNNDLPIINITDHMTLINWYILRQVLMNFGKRFTDRIMIQTSLFGVYFILLLCWLFMILIGKTNANIGILVI
jgi:hypothetical protein